MLLLMKKLAWLILFLPLILSADQIPQFYFNAVVALGRTESVPITQQTKWVTEASGFLYGYLVQTTPTHLNGSM